MKIEPWMWEDYAGIYSQMLALKRARRDLVRILRTRGDFLCHLAEMEMTK